MSDVKPTLSQLRRFVGNPDAYAVQGESGRWRPVRESLTDAVLEAHLAQTITVGTYIGHKPAYARGATVARTLCLDIDSGSTLDAAAYRVALLGLGVPAASIGVEFSGRKGFHVWVLVDALVPNSQLRRLGRAAQATVGEPVEIYPKQDEVKDLGNLVKLPGGVHQVTGKQNNFVYGSRVPRPMSAAVWDELVKTFPPEVAARTAAYVEEVRFPCLASIQEEGVQEGSRNISLVHLGVMLRRAGLTSENVALVLARTNEKGQPVDDEELEGILRQSSQTGPLCSQLPAERHCGDLCLLSRLRGLRDFPGQLRGAAVGEKVVVTMAERRGNDVFLEHSDVAKMRGVLKDAR
jgi:hypothetical protein